MGARPGPQGREIVTPERDPRIDPRPGDVLAKKQVRRTVVRIEQCLHPWVVCSEALHRSGSFHFRTVIPALSQFRRWAAGAEVLERGE